jgi:3-hydroxyisobutyrate dehydrogenase-like beta-hydroxyacid dehydrogenase
VTAWDGATVTVAVLGLGEAGGAISRDLVAAGARVRGHDPAVRPGPGLIPCAGEADAAAGTDVVLSVNSAKAAQDALRAGLSGLREGAIWADLSSSSPTSASWRTEPPGSPHTIDHRSSTIPTTK